MKKQPYFDKQYLKRTFIYALVSIVSIAVIIYLSYHISNNFRKGVETIFAREATIQSTITCEGYIMRDEAPIYVNGNSHGSLSAAVEDGEKVRANSKVADIYEISSPDVESKLSSIEKQISLLESCKSVSMTVGDVGPADSEIFKAITDMRKAAEAGDFGKELSLKTDLFLNIKKRDVLTGAISDFDEHISRLENEKSSLKMSLGTCLQTIYSQSAGYYYSECDGYEEIFSSKNIDSLTLSSFNDMTRRDADQFPQGSFSAGKIVKDHKWYLACPMSLTDAAKIEEIERTGGSVYKVTLQNNSEEALEMSLYKILKNSTDTLVLFECGIVKEGLNFTRFQSAQITTGDVTGYKIPVSAVRLVNDVEGVYILNKVTVEFRRIIVVDEASGYYICKTEPAEDGSDASEWLAHNDVILVGGKGLSPGMTLNPSKR